MYHYFRIKAACVQACPLLRTPGRRHALNPLQIDAFEPLVQAPFVGGIVYRKNCLLHFGVFAFVEDLASRASLFIYLGNSVLVHGFLKLFSANSILFGRVPNPRPIALKTAPPAPEPS